MRQAKWGKKSQVVKNHEISAFSMCYHIFSNVVNKANNTAFKVLRLQAAKVMH